MGVNGNVNGLGYYDVYGSYGQKDKDGNIITNYNNSVGFTMTNWLIAVYVGSKVSLSK